MQQVVIVIHLIIVLALVGVVLLQRSEGGALGIGSGGGGGGGLGGFMTGRGQANALTRATAILAVCFFTTSLILAVLASSNRAPRSILDGVPAAPASTPGQLPAGGGVLDQLRQLQGDAPAGQAPAAPSAPAPSAPAPAAPQAPVSR